MKLKLYTILEKAIIKSMELGYRKALNHNDYASQEVIRAEMLKCIMNSLKEIIGPYEPSSPIHKDKVRES